MHCEVLCLALGGDERKGIANADATLREPTFFFGRQVFFFVFESLRAEFSYLGPKEHKSSKILSSVNKKESCVYK